MQRTVLMINICLILTKFRYFRDFKKFAKFNTRRQKIAQKLNTRNSIPFLFFSKLESGQNPPNPVIWLVPRAGGILRSFPLTRAELLVALFTSLFVVCEWAKPSFSNHFSFQKLALLLALAGEKWILLFRQKIWKENQASPLSLSVQQAVMFCLVHKVLCTCRTVVSLQSCSWNVQWNPALRPPRL